MEELKLEERSVTRGAVGTSRLEVAPSGIRFRNVAPERVLIEIEITNRGTAWSQPTPILIRSAPLGAFVPWQPLATVEAPPIAPRVTTVVSFETARPRTEPLGDFSGLVPDALRTAVGAGDGAPTRFDPNLALLVREKMMDRFGGLAPDPFALLDRTTTRWIGNIDVLIRRKSVERHLARGLRVYPGRANIALLFVGDSRRGCVLQTRGSAAAWSMALVDPAEGRTVPRLDEGTFHLATRGPFGLRTLLLALRPPADAQRGSLELHFHRLAEGDSAVVEFDLDARAAGTGCYAV